MWLFSDSIFKGDGQEIHFLMDGYNSIMDRTGGAKIGTIKEVVENTWTR